MWTLLEQRSLVKLAGKRNGGRRERYPCNGDKTHVTESHTRVTRCDCYQRHTEHCAVHRNSGQYVAGSAERGAILTFHATTS